MTHRASTSIRCIVLVSLTLGAGGSVVAQTQVYRSVGPQGEVVFSDRAGGNAQRIELDAPAPAENAQTAQDRTREVLAVAGQLEASRLQREQLRLERERLRLQAARQRATRPPIYADPRDANRERIYLRDDHHHGHNRRVPLPLEPPPPAAEEPATRYRFKWHDRPS